ncbi:MAG: amidase [Natronomonas sp.]
MNQSLSLPALADALRTDRRDVRETVSAIRGRVEEIEPDIESLVPESGRFDRLRNEAEAVADRYPTLAERPSLYCVPVGVKDIFHVAELPTRAGSDLPPAVLEGLEATSVTRLREAGALVLGKTVTAEFAYSDPGPTRNPHALDHTPGGSSSGSAAAVAAGLCPLALGTQTIGSVIRPAAFCGIVGFKPTADRIPTDGVISFSSSVDHVGAFTRETAGMALAAPVLFDSWQTLPDAGSRPTLGVPDGPYLEQVSDVGRSAFEEQLGGLETAGYRIEEVDVLDDIEKINERHERLIAAELALAHEDNFDEYRDRYADVTRRFIETGRTVPTAEIATGRRSREELRERLETWMDDAGIDIWIAPAARGPAPSGIDDTGDPVVNLPWTHAGMPTIALPAGRTDGGLPLGVQCVGRFGADEDILRWSHDLETAL